MVWFWVLFSERKLSYIKSYSFLYIYSHSEIYEKHMELFMFYFISHSDIHLLHVGLFLIDVVFSLTWTFA